MKKKNINKMRGGGPVVEKRGGGMMKKNAMAMAMGGNVSPRKAIGMKVAVKS